MWTIKAMKFIKLWEAIKIFNKCDDFRHIFEGLAFGQGLETFISCPFMGHSSHVPSWIIVV